MTLKEINSKAGSISDYLGYIVLLFGWSITDYVYPHGLLESAGLLSAGNLGD